MSKQQCCYCDSRSHDVMQCPKDRFVVTSILENTKTQFDFKSLNNRLLKRMLHVFKSKQLERELDAKPKKDIKWLLDPNLPTRGPKSAPNLIKERKKMLHQEGIYTPPNVLPNLETLINKKCNKAEMVWALTSHHKAWRRLRYRRKTKNQKNKNKGEDCPICYKDMKDQYCTLVCNHKVCKTCYPRLWMDSNGRCKAALCPMCRQPQVLAMQGNIMSYA